jgi:hypothetical protein
MFTGSDLTLWQIFSKAQIAPHKDAFFVTIFDSGSKLCQFITSKLYFIAEQKLQTMLEAKQLGNKYRLCGPTQ